MNINTLKFLYQHSNIDILLEGHSFVLTTGALAIYRGTLSRGKQLLLLLRLFFVMIPIKFRYDLNMLILFKMENILFTGLQRNVSEVFEQTSIDDFSCLTIQSIAKEALNKKGIYYKNSVNFKMDHYYYHELQRIAWYELLMNKPKTLLFILYYFGMLLHHTK